MRCSRNPDKISLVRQKSKKNHKTYTVNVLMLVEVTLLALDVWVPEVEATPLVADAEAAEAEAEAAETDAREADARDATDERD
jgi:hypothetical protein